MITKVNRRVKKVCLGGIPLIIALLLGLEGCHSTAKEETGEFVSFFPDSNTYSQFIALREELVRVADSINQLEAPGKEIIEAYFNQWKKADTFNRNLLDQKFTTDTNARGKRISLFNFLNYAIQYGHAGREFKEDKYGFQWEEVVEYYLPKIKAAETDEECILLCDEMISLLDDAHTYIGYTSNDLLKSLMVDIRSREGKWILTGFMKHLPSEQAEPGDELISLDGLKPGHLWNELLPKTPFGEFGKMDELFERRFLRTYYYYKIHPTGKDSSLLVFQKKNGHTYPIKLKWHPVRQVRNMYGVRLHNGPKRGIEGKILPQNGYGYIRIDSWNPDFMETWDTLIIQMKNCPGLILDVRNNFGGDFTNFGQRVLGSFQKEDRISLYKKFRNSPLYHLYGFNGLHYQENTSAEEAYYPPVPVKGKMSEIPMYRHPVVLLINGKHFSSTDLFLIAWHEGNTGAVIGRMNDFQLAGQPIRITTPWNNWKLGLSVMLPLTDRKVTYEDRQIPLDIRVPLTRNEIMLKTDPILDSALIFLNKKCIEQAENSTILEE